MQYNCWSLRCSWSIACRRCSNYIFIHALTPGFNGLCKDNYRTRRETFQFWDLVRLIWEVHGSYTLVHLQALVSQDSTAYNNFHWRKSLKNVVCEMMYAKWCMLKRVLKWFITYFFQVHDCCSTGSLWPHHRLILATWAFWSGKIQHRDWKHLTERSIYLSSSSDGWHDHWVFIL